MKRSGRTLLVLLSLAAAAGCTTAPGRYTEQRMLDLLDAVPISLAVGNGLSAHARLTPLLGVGAGYAEVYRFGFDDGRFGPYWQEKIYAIPLLSTIRYQTYPTDGDRWPGGNREKKAEHDRYRANTFLFFPGYTGDGSVLPDLGGDAEWHRSHFDHWDWAQFEIGVVLGFVGLRVGGSGLQALDFLAGLLTFDPADDDIRHVERAGAAGSEPDS